MSLVLPHEHPEPQEAFYCTQSEEQNLSQPPPAPTQHHRRHNHKL